MFTIKIVRTFCKESVCIRKKEFQNACLGFQISRAPPSWIIVTCRGCSFVPEQLLFVSEQQGNHDMSQLFKMAAPVNLKPNTSVFEIHFFRIRTLSLEKSLKIFNCKHYVLWVKVIFLF